MLDIGYVAGQRIFILNRRLVQQFYHLIRKLRVSLVLLQLQLQLVPVKIVKTFSRTTIFEDLIKYFIETSKKFYPQIILKFCFRFIFKITKPNLYGSRSERRELKTGGLMRVIDMALEADGVIQRVEPPKVLASVICPLKNNAGVY